MQMAEHTARVATSSFLKRIGLSPLANAFRTKASGMLPTFQNGFSVYSVSPTL
jgi:DNA primase large subunit